MKAADAIAEFHAANPVAFLATTDGDRPYVRPMSPVEIDGEAVWMATGASSDKMSQVRACDEAELCYMKPDHSHLRLAGRLEVCDDAAKKTEAWNAYPMMHEYFKSPDDPEYVLLRFVVREARRMPAMSYAYEPLETSAS